MNEITRVALDNEMDLILAHRQSMKMLELAGMSVSLQTTFATAVSEIARVAIEKGKEASLILSVSDKKDRDKKIRAVIKDGNLPLLNDRSEGYRNAKRLVDNIEITDGGSAVQLDCNIPFNFRIDDMLVEKWVILFNTDPEVTPYEEIKRKNKQLKDLSSQLRKSEEQYRTLTNSLPLMIFTLNDKGHVTYANSWLQEYSGQTIETLNKTRWKEVLHPDDMHAWDRWDNPVKDYVAVSVERRLKDYRTGEYRWYTGIVTPVLSETGELQYWTAYLADIHAQKTVEAALKDNVELKETQRRLESNIAELNRSNRELEQFAYVASHDLQEPLRKISFYSDFLQTNYKDILNKEGKSFIDNIVKATDRMRGLIHDILAYSTINKETRKFTRVDMNKVAREALHDLEIAIKEKKAVVNVAALPGIEGNENQLKQLFENILSNSLKYTTPGKTPEITVSAQSNEGKVQFFFSDNGIGFEEKYLDKMFTLFQRLHGKNAYMGTGIGLSICKKIADIHNGTITARSQPGNGATFIVSLPEQQHSK